MNHPEFELQRQVCAYLCIKYPEVFFLSDTVAFLKLNIQQAKRNSLIQKKGFKCPDLIVLSPMGGYSGLFIELKTTTPYKKNGEIKASQNDHIKLQHKIINELRNVGYKADFAWSFEMATKIIDDYFLIKKRNK